MTYGEPSLKIVRLLQSQYHFMTWLRKSTKFLETQLSYSRYTEYLLDTISQQQCKVKAMLIEQQRHFGPYTAALL